VAVKPFSTNRRGSLPEKVNEEGLMGKPADPGIFGKKANKCMRGK